MIHVDHVGKMESREPSTSISEAVKRAAEKLNYSPLKAVSEQARVTEGFLEGLYVFVITASIHLKTIILINYSNINNDVAGFHWWCTIFWSEKHCTRPSHAVHQISIGAGRVWLARLLLQRSER